MLERDQVSLMLTAAGGGLSLQRVSGVSVTLQSAVGGLHLALAAASASLALQEARPRPQLRLGALQGGVAALLPVVAAAPSGVYLGPEDGAPQQVTRPWLLILREPGAPAAETSFVIREPDGG